MKIRLIDDEFSLVRYIALWTVVVLMFAWQGLMDDSLSGSTWSLLVYLRWSAIQWYTWAALAPFVFRIAARYPIEAPLRWSNLRVQLAASTGLVAVAVIVGALISSLTEHSSFEEQYKQFICRHVVDGYLAYGVLVAIGQALHFQREKTRREVEASRLSAELAQSRLQVLKTQLQPHFLFNTLHAIVTLLEDEPASAEDMLLRLSDLLRALLEDREGQEVSLRRELELLDLYLGIQRMRFKDRLTTRIYIAPDTLDCAVPGLILQPLVENAIRHGIGRHVGSDCVEIESRREGELLCLEVRNSNSVLDAGAKGGHGIGLSNTELRLRELYGDVAQIRLDMLWPRGVACRVRLPLRRIAPADADLPGKAA